MKKYHLKNSKLKCAKLCKEFFEVREALQIRTGIARCMRKDFVKARKG